MVAHDTNRGMVGSISDIAAIAFMRKGGREGGGAERSPRGEDETFHCLGLAKWNRPSESKGREGWDVRPCERTVALAAARRAKGETPGE